MVQGRDGECNPCSEHEKIGANTLTTIANKDMVQRDHMRRFDVQTGQRTYSIMIERGILRRVSEFIPGSVGKAFIVTTEDVWRLHGQQVEDALKHEHDVLFLAGGEVNKRLAAVEELAEQMVSRGADRTSIVIGFGGGIVTDVSGFLAAVFMRGIQVLQIPTTLMAQVDAAIGGKTGVNLIAGKNLIGSFHQPLAVLVDPEVISTLSDREYRAGLFEVLKCGVIRDRGLFDLLANLPVAVLGREPEYLDDLIAGAVQIKAEVVSADERENDLRRILNFGHTIGHAIEAETEYVRFLHGEAVAWGMIAATRLSEILELLDPGEAQTIRRVICRYGPLPSPKNLDPDRLLQRLAADKKTFQGKVHFVLPTRIGQVKIVSGIEPAAVRRAIVESLQESS